MGKATPGTCGASTCERMALKHMGQEGQRDMRLR